MKGNKPMKTITDIIHAVLGFQSHKNGADIPRATKSSYTMNTARTSVLALVSVLFLGLTALLPLGAKAQLLGSVNIQSFPMGNGPDHLVFDGANIWVTNTGDDTVTKLRASDGTNLGTFPVGDYPRWITFDGASIWVVNIHSNNVTKLRASDGVVLGTFAVGSFPEGIAYDGANIWVANFFNDKVTKLRASDGVVLGTYPVGDYPLRSLRRNEHLGV
jgi:hypothetical protein